MEDGLGPGVVAAVGELSREEEGELGLLSLVVVGLAVFLLISGGLQRKSGRVWSQHTPVPPFSVRSLGVEMLERGIMCLHLRWALVFPVMCCPGFPGCFLERGIVCLVSGALALVFPVMCCPGFPGCFPESRPWVRSLGPDVIRHSLHVMSSVGRAQPGCP